MMTKIQQLPCNNWVYLNVSIKMAFLLKKLIWTRKGSSGFFQNFNEKRTLRLNGHQVVDKAVHTTVNYWPINKVYFLITSLTNWLSDWVIERFFWLIEHTFSKRIQKIPSLCQFCSFSGTFFLDMLLRINPKQNEIHKKTIFVKKPLHIQLICI